jgi:S-adenosylmethionine/arginine decarboxylase-like enzyme
MRTDPQRWSYAIDGLVTRKGVLADIGYLSNIVYKIAAETGMEIINLLTSNIKEDLRAMDLPVFCDEGGYSIQALISTSHISLHGWPNREYFMLDVVSCRKFDAEELHKLIICWLEVKEVIHHAVYKPKPNPSFTHYTPVEFVYSLTDKAC